MRVLSKREPFRYFQFPDPDPSKWYLFLFLVYVRIFHHSWNCTFVFLFKVQGPFLQKRSTNTELSFNLYDLTKEFNPGKKNNVDHCFNNSGVFLYIPGHLNWHTWQDFLWKRFFLNQHELSFFPVGDCTIALLQFISTITFLKNWGENPLHSIQRKIIIPKNIDNYWTQILIHVLLYH